MCISNFDANAGVDVCVRIYVDVDMGVGVYVCGY